MVLKLSIKNQNKLQSAKKVRSIMSTGIKTLSGWNEFADRTGKVSVNDYLNVGDIVSGDLVDFFLNIMPPRSSKSGYLQVGEPYDHVYDCSRALRPIYMTFAECDGQWRYYGNCFAWETVDKSWR